MTFDPFASGTPSSFRMNYVWDEPFHLFRRANVQEFAYSDGEEVEKRLFDVVSKASDRSTFSRELYESITDWPSEYHFSRSRHCLLRPLGIRPGDKVLEIGCGCGAITRFLGEINAEVVAVEGSLGRARVAAERCRELGNVRVVVDDFLRFETEERFDWVLLIGVLEYAAMFSDRENPFEHYLRSVSRFLVPGGRVVVAIENKVGLKYFNGCSEDHIGVPFFGIQDLYGDRTIRTFGRRELIEQFSAAGLIHTYFYYPFPDYKLPSVIISADGFRDREFATVDLLARSHARDYSGSLFRGFDDALAFSALSDNDLVADLSNSFLVVATTQAQPQNSEGDLAFTFSANNRIPEFATQTKFVRIESKLGVLKEYLTTTAGQRCVVIRGTTIWNQLTDSDYYPGRQLLWGLLRARARSGGVEQIVQALRPWMEFLLKHARVPTAQIADFSGRPPSPVLFTLPGDFLDCTPFNLLETPTGLVYIDAEWKIEDAIPLGWVIARGVLYSLFSGLPSTNQLHSILEVVEALCGDFGILVSVQEVQAWLQQEADFQTVAAGRGPQEITAQWRPGGTRSFVSEIATLNQGVAARDEQIGSLHQALAARGDEISGLVGEINRLTDETNRLTDETNRLTDETNRLTDETNRPD